MVLCSKRETRKDSFLCWLSSIESLSPPLQYCTINHHQPIAALSAKMCQSQSGLVLGSCANNATASRAPQERADLNESAPASDSADNCDPTPPFRGTPRLSLRRRRKRDRQSEWSRQLSAASRGVAASSYKRTLKKKKKSNMARKHGDDAKSGGLDALLPSIAGVVVLFFVVLARLGFRGRATFVGIDLGKRISEFCWVIIFSYARREHSSPCYRRVAQVRRTA